MVRKISLLLLAFLCCFVFYAPAHSDPLLTGGSIDLFLGYTWAVAGPIGSTTPNTGAFTDLSASGAVSGNGFAAYLASPPAIGGTAPNTGTFSTATIQGTTGGLKRLVAEATGTPAGTTTTFVITLSIPTGSRLLGCQLRVDTALTAGETWSAAYSGGSTTAIVTTGQLVAKDTKVNKMHVDEITINTTNVTITRDSGNFTNGVGVIRAIVYYELFVAMANSP